MSKYIKLEVGTIIEPGDRIVPDNKIPHTDYCIDWTSRCASNNEEGTTYTNSIVSVYRPVSPINTIHISQRPSITKRFNKR